MMIFWGQEALCLYNNTFRQALGPERHPHALGRPAREVWKEAWPVIGTDVEQVMRGKGPIKQLNYKLPYTRYGQQKYGHWTFSLTPLEEEEAASWRIGGVLSVCTEATDQECAPPVFNPECDLLSQMFNHASAFMVYLSGPEHRYEIANPSHAQLIGHRPVLGKTIREALPDAVEQGFEDILDHVYATGTTYRANNAQYGVQVTPGGPVNERILDFVYQPLWGPDGKISGVFAEGTDVTDQVLTQEELERVNRELAETLDHQKESERRNSFRLKLTDSLRSLADPDEITAAATALLGEFLGVTRVFYGDVSKSGETVTVMPGWTSEGAVSMVGDELPLEEFGPVVAAQIRAGEVFVLGDVIADERSADYANAYLERGIKAVLAVPVMKAGSLRVLLGVHDSEVHHWTAKEIALAEDVVDRTWAAVESARAQAELRRERDYSRYILNSMTEGFAAMSADWTMTQFNAEAERISHQPAPEVIGRNLWEVWPEQQGTAVEELYTRVRETGEPAAMEFSLTTPDDNQKWLEVRAYPALDGGLAVFFRDITERKQADEEIRHASLHDPLTGLPNRAMLFEYAAHLLPHNLRTSQCAAVLFLDLDRFKPINDTHGHDVGDKVLKEISSRITRSLRAEDLVVRMGGDEFVVLLQDISVATDAGDLALHIIRKINEPYLVEELTLSVSTSIGISIFPRDGEDIDTLVSHADAAMYQAKQGGRDNFQFYSSAFTAGINRQISIEQELKMALHNHAFHLFYQPVIDIHTHEVVSVEALLRLGNDEISPEQFVPIAEATGIINPIGRWVLQEAIRQSIAWTANGLAAIPIAVNVSAVEFRDRDFIDHFEQLLKEHAIDPAMLQLELTETAVMYDLDEAISVLTRLRDLGIVILLDDFGTGHSSLAHLTRLPLDKIKIDKSFIFQLEQDTSSRAVTDSMLALGNTLELEVVAEGIETAAALDYLRSRGCRQAQGYFFCRPMSGEDFESWYRTRRIGSA
ncbi:EAL domain-containing protein [Marinobacter sp. SS13-12]|uniref:EAL domain-containing protein n=1 Tax=Marinobacter sp. SS13-12 TaxID=3050451 RepID=UPI0025566BCC|nr:EAL domain-containing protein [Marinobacter sp. SS13-12]MDK8465006.1 EAL domain-containing protein [Marinobacter sp. SS13-12]